MPIGQGAKTPAAQKPPVGHATHELEPGVVVVVPAPQVPQLAEFAVTEKVPIAHALQLVEAPPPVAKPAGHEHTSEALLPTLTKLLLQAHDAMLVAPVTFVVEATGHAVHDVLEVWLTEPE